MTDEAQEIERLLDAYANAPTKRDAAADLRNLKAFLTRHTNANRPDQLAIIAAARIRRFTKQWKAQP